MDTIAGDTTNYGLGTDLATGDIYGNGKDALVSLGFNQSCGNLPCAYSYISVYTNNSGFHLSRSLYVDSRNVPGGFAPGGDGSIACFDADGDGIADILVSGICIFKGGTKIDTLPTYHVEPPNNDTTDFSAYPWVGGGGDYNGDGIPDILLASEGGSGVTPTPGFFVMVDGRGHPGQYMGYRVYSDYLGGAVDLSGRPQNAGDVNGAGVDDIIVGNGGWFYPNYYGFFGVYSGDASMVAAVKELHAPPSKFNLQQNYPNPFNPSTTIAYDITKRSRVTLTLYDVLGRKIETLGDNEESPGHYEVLLDASRLSSGIYFYQIRAGTFVQTRKLVVIK